MKKFSLETRIPAFTVENWLSHRNMLAVQDYLLTDGFPWYRSSGTVDEGLDGELTWFHHIFSFEGQVKSQFFYKFFFIFEQSFMSLGLNPTSIRANLMPIQAKRGQTAWHVDKTYPHTVVLYYVDDCDGPTLLDTPYGLREVLPKANKLLVFDGSIKHCAVIPENGIRTVVNFVCPGSLGTNFPSELSVKDV